MTSTFIFVVLIAILNGAAAWWKEKKKREAKLRALQALEAPSSAPTPQRAERFQRSAADRLRAAAASGRLGKPRASGAGVQVRPPTQMLRNDPPRTSPTIVATGSAPGISGGSATAAARNTVGAGGMSSAGGAVARPSVQAALQAEIQRVVAAALAAQLPGAPRPSTPTAAMGISANPAAALASTSPFQHARHGALSARVAAPRNARFSRRALREAIAMQTVLGAPRAIEPHRAPA